MLVEKVFIIFILCTFLNEISSNPQSLSLREKELQERRRHKKKRRPCRGRDAGEGRTFFPLHLSYVDVDTNYLCGSDGFYPVGVNYQVHNYGGHHGGYGNRPHGGYFPGNQGVYPGNPGYYPGAPGYYPGINPSFSPGINAGINPGIASGINPGINPGVGPGIRPPFSGPFSRPGLLGNRPGLLANGANGALSDSTVPNRPNGPIQNLVANRPLQNLLGQMPLQNFINSRPLQSFANNILGNRPLGEVLSDIPNNILGSGGNGGGSEGTGSGGNIFTPLNDAISNVINRPRPTRPPVEADSTDNKPEDSDNHNQGFFFGLFDGSLINNYFNRPTPTPTTVTPISSTEQKPVHEDYDEVVEDPQKYNSALPLRNPFGSRFKK